MNLQNTINNKTNVSYLKFSSGGNKQGFFKIATLQVKQNYANQNIILLSYRAEQERLQNEMSLAYNVYTQVAQQLQMAKAKVQEITPVYTVVQPATVPLRPSKPSKPMILIGFVFLAGVGSVGWILFIKDLLKGWKKQTTI